MDPDLAGLFSDEDSSDEEEENNFESNMKRTLDFSTRRYVILFSFYHCWFSIWPLFDYVCDFNHVINN